MEQIRIVEYHLELAEGIADMWNDSRDSWGGSGSITTGEQVRQEEANSDSLVVYLAMEGDMVVGYCGLSEYREDTGALYIPLLNVRPAYHGKKVGKMLVLKALEKTIQLGWPRLDLYTWSGNTKAVPLYKKCGFFWEDRDDTTHLMNLIPAVLQTEAIAHHFREIDWYADSTREIEVEPDGRKENQFDYFTYSWKTDTQELQVEFERRGRGIRLIETEDYLLSATVENLELVFGKEYTIQYRIVNKSGKPLHLAFQGEDDGIIRFDWQMECDATGETTLEGRFFVGEITEEQNVWRTHPAVRTRIRINGKEALFQVGIIPKFPAAISLRLPGSLCYLGQQALFYLDIENNFAEETRFSFELPPASFLQLDENRHTVTLQAKERISLPIPYRLLEHGYYAADLQVEAARKNGVSVFFRKKIGVGFSGLGAKLTGENEKYWQLHHGKYSIFFDKQENEMTINTADTADSPSMLFAPKLGKPYSSEFSKKRAQSVQFFEERGAIGMKVTYHSADFPQITLIGHTLLFAEGTVEHWFALENQSAEKTSGDLWISQPVYRDFYRTILPYEGRYIELKDSLGSEYEYWDTQKISENWLFWQDSAAPGGICWPADQQPHFSTWHMYLETRAGALAANERKVFPPIYLTFGTFTDWKAFRAFARQNAAPDDLPLTSHLELIANDHNPFVGEEISVVVKEHKQMYLDGELTVSLLGEAEATPDLASTAKSAALSAHYSPEAEANEARFSLLAPDRPLDLVQVSGQLATHDTRLRSVIFPVDTAEITSEQTEQDGEQVYTAENGLLRIKAAPGFFPALFSLSYREKEWLDHSFPKREAKSWWNPWIGGIKPVLEEFNAFSMLKEECTASFAHLTDNKGNRWQGLKLDVHVQQQEAYKGLSFSQYFLMLPGVPVLCHTARISQNTGTYFAGKEWTTDIFVRPGEKERGWMKTFNRAGEELTLKLGEGELFLREEAEYVFGSPERDHMLQIVTDQSSSQHTNAYYNKEVSVASVVGKLNLPHGSVHFTPPIFFLFTDRVLPADALADLKAIRFSQ